MLLPEKIAGEERAEVPDGPREEQLREIAGALHDLCQPLTALHCRLEIGQLVGTPAGYQEAVAEGLRECARLLRGVNQMRDLVRSAMERP